MKKFISLLTLGVVALLITSSVLAQEDVPPPNSGAQQWFCLKPVHKGHNADLSAYPMGTEGKGSPIPGFPVYVFVRIDNKLTTGNPTVDLDPNVLGSRANYDYLGQFGFGKLGKVGLTTSNPTEPADATGLVPPVVDWHDDLNAEDAKDHFWFGMQIVPPTGNGVETGNDLAQKFGTFEFSRAKGGSDCEYIKWDPFGYVFDAQTLAPIPNAIITIYDAKTGKIVPAGTGPGTVATNPFRTAENGSYTFFTDEGSYKMTLEGSYNGKPLVIEDVVANVNPSYSDPSYGYTNLYHTGMVITEVKNAAGVVEIVRSDIPVKTVGVPPAVQIPQLQEVNIDRTGEQITVKGKVSALPAEVIAIYKDLVDPNAIQTLPVTVDAVERRFTFTGDQTLENGYVFSEIAVKQGTLTNKGFFGAFISLIHSIEDTLFSVRAQNVTSMKIDPIPSYIEGIAQDGTGNILTSALVGIYLQGSNVAAYQTKTDINGHYVIGSQFVPPLPYELRIKKVTGEIIKLSTTEYLRQNAEYHKTNDISSFSTIKTTTAIDSNNTLVVTKTVVPQNNDKTNTNGSQKGNNTGSSNQTGAEPTKAPGIAGMVGAGSQGIIMVLVAIVMLVLVGIGAFVMMKSKQSQQPPQF